MARLPRHLRPTPMTVRSRLVLEIAAELVAMRDQPNGQAKVLLRSQGGDDWILSLFGSSTVEGVHEVVDGTSTLAIVNPSAALSLAYTGKGSYFSRPLPVRTIAVIPSRDKVMFAVAKDTGLTHIEQIGEREYPLRLSLRGQLDHWLHPMLDDIVRAAGFSLDDVRAWGGDVRREGHIPYAGGPKFEAMARGEITAIFDESVNNWANEVPAAGMTVLQMRDDTMAKLVAMGYRRDVLRRADYPNLPDDVPTLDFSGWPVVVHADAEDELVTQICRGLEARKHLIPWQEEGPLPLADMVRDTPSAPLDVPLHPAALRIWRAQGYLD